MFAANVLGELHVMMGMDLHTTWPPASLAPTGIVPHGVVQILNGYNMTVSKASNTMVTYMHPIHQGSDIGNFIPHIQVSLLLPLVIAFSSSKSQFGVSTVSLEGKPIGVACAMVVNMNMNCSEPVCLPYGIVAAMPMTVQAGFTATDLMMGAGRMAIDMAVSAVTHLFFGANGPGGKLVGSMMGSINRQLSRGLIVPIVGAMQRRLAGRVVLEYGRRMEKKLLEGMVKTLPSILMSGSTVAPANTEENPTVSAVNDHYGGEDVPVW